MSAVQTLPRLEQAPAVQAPRLYEPELDLLRFLAFAGVFCFHALPSDYSGMVARLGPVLPQLLFAVRNAFSFGVCMFFLLSAYLISKLLVVERATTGTVHLRSFYIRRMLRVWPLYFAFLFLMYGLGLPKAGLFPAIETGRLLAFLFFSGNIYSSFFGFTFNPILPLWTVSIEEQFYILWPNLVARGERFLKYAAWTVIGVSILATFLLRTFASNPTLATWTSSLVQFQFFAIGSLVATRYKRGLPSFPVRVRVLLALAGSMLVLCAAGPLHLNAPGFTSTRPISAPWMVFGYEMMAAGILMVFLAFLGAMNGVNRIPRWLTYLGKISYGLYVFHVLALGIGKTLADHYGIHGGFRTVFGAVATVVLAMLSHHFLEMPFLRLKDRFAFVQSRSAHS